jgi:hypothetical protein
MPDEGKDYIRPYDPEQSIEARVGRLEQKLKFLTEQLWNKGISVSLDDQPDLSSEKSFYLSQVIRGMREGKGEKD